MHFGNDGKNIRKFRQTVRDAWERHVSGVYPEAKADFDTTVVRLYPSPAPLQQKPVPGIRLTAATDDHGTPVPRPEPTPKDARFRESLIQQLGEAAYWAWFRDAVLTEGVAGWTLTVRTASLRDHIRTQFDLVLGHAMAVADFGSISVDVKAP